MGHATGAQRHRRAHRKNYTVKSLRDVEDVAPQVGVDAAQELRFAQRDLNATGIGVSLMTIKAGRRQVIAHRHDQAEEVYVVMSGSGRVKLDDDIVEVHALDAVRVAPEVTRAFEGGPQGLEYVVFGPRHEADGAVQPIEEFWP